MPKISQYPSQSGASVANGDLIPIVDVGSPNVTERITVDELAQAPQFSSRYAPLPGAWTVYTPTVRSGTGTITSVTAAEGRYAQLGKLVIVHFTFTVTTRGTAGGFAYVTLPVNARGTTYYFAQLGTYREILNTGIAGGVCFESATEMVLVKNDFTSPFGTNGDVFRGSITYEAA